MPPQWGSGEQTNFSQNAPVKPDMQMHWPLKQLPWSEQLWRIGLHAVHAREPGVADADPLLADPALVAAVRAVLDCAPYPSPSRGAVALVL